MLAGIEHRLVLRWQGHDVVALVPARPRHSLDGQVVRLGCTRGENDLLRTRVDQLRNLLARRLDGCLRFPAKTVVATGGVAIVLGEVREHDLEHARVNRRGRMIVHVNRKLHGRLGAILRGAPPSHPQTPLFDCRPIF